jgi:hypothetical protein
MTAPFGSGFDGLVHSNRLLQAAASVSEEKLPWPLKTVYNHGSRFHARASKVEPLAQTISLARPKGLIWKQLEAVGDWAIRFPANDGVVFTMSSAAAVRARPMTGSMRCARAIS